MQAQPGLRFEEAAHREVDPGAAHPPRLHRFRDGLHRRADPVRRQHHIRPGFQRDHRRLPRPVAIGDRAHAQRVGEEDAAEAHLTAQHLGHEVRGHRGGPVVAQHPRHRDVRGHHRVHPRIDRHAEGEQFHPVHAIAVGADHRQLDVRVRPRVAVPREVLGGGKRPARPRAPDEGRAEPPHRFGILAEGTGVDDGVVGVAVHVEYGREEPVHAYRTRLLGGDPPVFEGQVLVAGGAEGHGGREAGTAALRQQRWKRIAVVDAHPGTAVLEVGGYQERDPRARL